MKDWQDSLVRQVQSDYPDMISGRERTRRHSGQFNHILFVDDSVVFRFPKYAHLIPQAQLEAQVLVEIAPLLPLPVPVPIYCKLDDRVTGSAYLGHIFIPGEPLRLQVLQLLPRGVQLRLAHQIGAFLKALHGIRAEQISTRLPIADTLEDAQGMYKEVQEKLFPSMRADARERIAAHYETYLAATELHAFTPVLRHGDFGPSNILYNHEEKCISGIIDFNSIAFGDPAVDIASLSCLSDSFVEQCSMFYPEIASMLPRARYYKGTYALEEALAGLRDGDPQAYARGMETFI
jgi:aminoglycoside 2''-phosphotransferase